MTSRPTCLCCLYFSLIAVAVYLEVWKCIVMFTCVLCFQVALLWHCSKRCESTLVHCNVQLRVEFYFQVHSVPRCSVALLLYCTKRCESRSPPSRIVSTDIQEFSLSLSLWPPSYITLNTFDTLPSSPIYTIQLLNSNFQFWSHWWQIAKSTSWHQFPTQNILHIRRVKSHMACAIPIPQLLPLQGVWPQPFMMKPLG